MTIELETTITVYTQDAYIKPTAPFWKIVNSGQALVFLNKNFFLWPQTDITVDMLSIAAKFIEKGILIEQNTEYHLTFLQPAFSPPPPAISLIQTFIKVHK